MRCLRPLATVVFSCALCIAAPLAVAAPPAGAATNVVLVHGALVDGSGWEGVAAILMKDGYTVSVVQHPETSLSEDVKATRRVLDLQGGPTVLVGHSYGGTIITEAGTHAKVVALVYVAALQPDAGENTGALAGKMPAASNGIKKTSDGYLYFDPALFHADFAADLPKAKAQFMAISQVLINSEAFGETVTDPAWRKKPSWALVATDDRTLNPDLERWMAKRANSKTIEVKGSHASYISHPKEVARLIEQAAAGATTSATR